ncbi:hypothetical protein B0H13DRAFT_2337942 [Mycena leptocephala]|nr:hypothetical protein B0H13DRAFT_2337942 [Mycena leptocephala]
MREDYPDHDADFDIDPFSDPGWNLDAWEYIPISTRGPHPVIVMANGLGCNKVLGLAAYAENFRPQAMRAWYSITAVGVPQVLHGTRRNCVYVSEQQDDYRTVVKYARQQPQFDPQRVVVWGFSFAGGHILTLASDPALNVAARWRRTHTVGARSTIPI